MPYCSGGYTFQSDPLKCAIPGTRPNVYPKGIDHLNPSQALDFVRSRDGLVGTDYGRQRHQQQFIKAVLQEVYKQGLNDPLKLNSFIGSLGKALVIDRGSASLEDWIFTLKGITPNSLVAIKTNDGQTVRYDGSAGPISRIRPGAVTGQQGAIRRGEGRQDGYRRQCWRVPADAPGLGRGQLTAPSIFISNHPPVR